MVKITVLSPNLQEGQLVAGNPPPITPAAATCKHPHEGTPPRDAERQAVAAEVEISVFSSRWMLLSQSLKLGGGWQDHH